MKKYQTKISFELGKYSSNSTFANLSFFYIQTIRALKISKNDLEKEHLFEKTRYLERRKV